MKRKASSRVLVLIIVSIMITGLSCAAKKNIKFSKRKLPAQSSIAVVYDGENNLKNVVLVKFLSRGYNIRAFNSADLYRLSDIFDIKDLKKVSYGVSADAGAVLSMQKSFNNIYKLHFYNYEINKAELLTELKNKWKVDYLVILDLQNWEEVSWGRLIDLQNYEIMWLENYPTRYGDNIETIMDHLINSMSGK